MLKYVSQFFLQIFPSVVATVVGAYIVNHYIIPKAGSDAPKAAAYSKATPGAGDDQGAIDVTPKSATSKSDTLKSETAAIPDSKPDAKGKAADNKNAEKPVEAAKVDTKASADAKRPAPREKTAVRTVLPPTNETATASIAPTAPTQTDERRDRDANELARAAIERLRSSGEATHPAEPQHAQEPVREAVRETPPAAREPARVNVVAMPPAVQPRPIVQSTVVQPLPPPVTVMAPPAEASAGDVSQGAAPYAPRPRVADANRLIPPADIPSASAPIDLQPASTRTSVADDVLSAARSVIHTIVPQ